MTTATHPDIPGGGCSPEHSLHDLKNIYTVKKKVNCLEIPETGLFTIK